jgi:hypothetical protein
MRTKKYKNKLWSDCKTYQELADFIESGRAYETGVIADAISSEVAAACRLAHHYQIFRNLPSEVLGMVARKD